MEIRRAVAGDAPAVADLAWRCPQQGAITVATVPGPRAVSWEQFVNPRIVWVAQERDKIVGTVSLGNRCAIVDDRWTRWGYGGDLRVAPEARRSGVGAALIATVAECEREAGSFFTAFLTLGGNRPVQQVFRRRKELPPVVALSRMSLIQWLTLREPDPDDRIEARPARPDDLPEMFRVLQSHWSRRSLSPPMTLEDFSAEWQRDPSLSLRDAVVAEKGGRLSGCGALWDQRPLRQEIVLRYGFPYGVVARGVSAYARMVGAQRLPEIGQPLPSAFIRWFAADDLPTACVVRDSLLQMARRRSLLIVMLGIDSRDPFIAVRRGRLHTSLTCTLWAAEIRGGFDLQSVTRRPAWVDFSVV